MGHFHTMRIILYLYHAYGDPQEYSVDMCRKNSSQCLLEVHTHFFLLKTKDKAKENFEIYKMEWKTKFDEKGHILKV